MSRRWVVNASPIISLSRIGHVSLLELLCTELIIPKSVANEVTAGPDGDHARLWIEGDGARYVKSDTASDPRVPILDLGAGESSVISFALNHGINEVVLDDLEARKVAIRLNLKPLGTLSVIVLAKREGIVPAVAPLLDRLIKDGMRVSKALVDEVLILADEGSQKT